MAEAYDPSELGLQMSSYCDRECAHVRCFAVQQALLRVPAHQLWHPRSAAVMPMQPPVLLHLPPRRTLPKLKLALWHRHTHQVSSNVPDYLSTKSCCSWSRCAVKFYYYKHERTCESREVGSQKIGLRHSADFDAIIGSLHSVILLNLSSCVAAGSPDARSPFAATLASALATASTQNPQAAAQVIAAASAGTLQIPHIAFQACLFRPHPQ